MTVQKHRDTSVRFPGWLARKIDAALAALEPANGEIRQTRSGFVRDAVVRALRNLPRRKRV